MSRLPLDFIDGRELKVLVVDAERDIADLFSRALAHEGALVRTAHDGATAISAARSFRPDLIIVDARVPDMDGATLMRHLTAGRFDVPIIAMRPKPARHDRSRRDDRSRDRLFKPFSIEDSLSRVRMTLRNSGIDHASVRSASLVGDLFLDEKDRSVRRGGHLITMTATEFDLLRFFVRNVGRVLSTREILGRVWPYDYAGQPSQVRLYVSYLRKRIDQGRTPMIHTLRGTGYIFKPSFEPHMPNEAIPPRIS